ncbi:MAG: hypothetical protein EON50_02495 [Acidovorax sp.]|nr:MAG: hypothetical protein EON50_02495 [Acidovorax sp.]
MNSDTPLSGFAASPRSRNAARCGQGDDALAAGRPLLGVSRLGRASCGQCDHIVGQPMPAATRQSGPP